MKNGTLMDDGVFLAFNQSITCMDVSVGDWVLFYQTPNLKGLSRWKGPAKVLELDETGVILSFGSETFKVARFRVRRWVSESEVVDQDGRAPRPTTESRIGNWQIEKAGVRTHGEKDANAKMTFFL